jgi:hypothetical protein
LIFSPYLWLAFLDQLKNKICINLQVPSNIRDLSYAKEYRKQGDIVLEDKDNGSKQ